MYCVRVQGERTMNDIQTLQWVLDRIEDYISDEYYDYSSSMESLKADIELALKETEQWTL